MLTRDDRIDLLAAASSEDAFHLAEDVLQRSSLPTKVTSAEVELDGTPGGAMFAVHQVVFWGNL